VSLNVHYKYNLLLFLIMKKSILNIGKALNKAEQKFITGGKLDPNPRPELCICHTIDYNEMGGVVGWSAISPTPECCINCAETGEC
jgi:hypothetical protein